MTASKLSSQVMLRTPQHVNAFMDPVLRLLWDLFFVLFLNNDPVGDADELFIAAWSRTFLGPVALKTDGGCVLRVPFSLLKGKPSGKSKAKSVAEKDLFAEFEEARHYSDSLQKATAGWSCWGLILAGRPAELFSQKSVLLTVCAPPSVALRVQNFSHDRFEDPALTQWGKILRQSGQVKPYEYWTDPPTGELVREFVRQERSDHLRPRRLSLGSQGDCKSCHNALPFVPSGKGDMKFGPSMYP